MILSRSKELHGANRVPQIIVSSIVPLVIAFFFLTGRVISRVYVIKIWGWDDTLIVIAFFNSLIMSILFMVATKYGHGWQLANVPFYILKKSFSITYATLILYQLALALTKLSILIFYLRVFTAKRERWLSWGTIGFIVVSSIPILLGNILQCDPSTQLSFFSNNTICLQPLPVILSSTIVNTSLDAWLIVMVIPVVLSLQIPTRQRLALMSVLSLGVFVIIASCVRISEILKEDRESDFTWLIADFDTWTVLEVSIGIVCACAPAMRPLIQKVFPKLLASAMSSMGRSTRTAVERAGGTRVSAIELGSTNLEFGGESGGFARREEAAKRDSWLSDSVSEEHLILQRGKMIRKTDSVGTERLYGLSGGERKSPAMRDMSDEMSLEEGVDGMLRRPPP